MAPNVGSLDCARTCTLYGRALAERVAGHVSGATAHGNVTDHGAQGVKRASSRARVCALVAHARSIAGAIGV